MNIKTTLALALALTGCTTAQVTTALQDGQLACAAGNAVVAVQAVTGNTTTAVLAKGASSGAVQATCALIQGVAVSPPAGGVAGTVTVVLPPSIKIPLAS